ncbi:hypothetical protein GY45DRAFT_1373509 [Cubamyces sp. BRFM 1775]|nr:hypothetical protein GY45DRAFT_1373509 [Cubamyces sp. BRFM 1775]
MVAHPAASAHLLASRSPDDPTIENTFGAWLVCASVGCMLFGLTTHQTYRYFRLYPYDTKGLKIMVVALFLLDLFHTITNIHICYYYLVSNYLRPTALFSGVWSLRLSITETGLMMVLSHSFFLRRIFLLGGKRLLPVALIGLLMVSEFAFAVAVTVMTFVLVTFEAFRRYQWMIWAMLGNAVLVDLVITCFLILYLQRSRTGFKRTDSMVDILMVYTINTGLSTSIVTVPAMICSIVMPDNLIWSSLYVVASKMYANSLLAVLNSRRSILDKGLEGFETGSFGLEMPTQSRKGPLALDRPPSFHAAHTGRHGLPRVNAVSVPLAAHPPAEPRHGPMHGWQAKESVIDVKVTTETFINIDGGGLARRLDDGGSDSGSLM